MAESSYRKRLYERYRSSKGITKEQAQAAELQRAPYLDHMVEQFFPTDPGSKVLELGCGDGALIRALRKRGFKNVSGIDGSAQQVELAHQLETPEVQHGDAAEALQRTADGAQDVVVAIDVLEHLTKDEVLVLADEVFRVLRLGGRWIIHTVNGESPFFGSVRYGDFTHETVFTQRSLSQLLQLVGFTNVACFEDRPTVHGFKSAVRSAGWSAVRTALRAYLVIETGSVANPIVSQNLVAVATK